MEAGQIALYGLIFIGMNYASFLCVRRYHFSRMVKLAETIVAHPQSSAGDRAWVDFAFTQAAYGKLLKLNHIPALFTASLTIVPRMISAFRAGRLNRVSDDYEKNLAARIAKLSGADPATGAWWGSETSSRLMHHSISVGLFNAFPMFMLVFACTFPAFIIGLASLPFALGVSVFKPSVVGSLVSSMRRTFDIKIVELTEHFQYKQG
ncbi:hypothetical protein [Shinella pollutisoli]|uniref:Uncharacterized protein n=1 Tax=Shinella pollutisoli TaxID=2250594 RepID=A0ABV7DBS2_9HYPH|nr:hypothetical protein [Shinella pollutisoli]